MNVCVVKSRLAYYHHQRNPSIVKTKRLGKPYAIVTSHLIIFLPFPAEADEVEVEEKNGANIESTGSAQNGHSKRQSTVAVPQFRKRGPTLRGQVSHIYLFIHDTQHRKCSHRLVAETVTLKQLV